MNIYDQLFRTYFEHFLLLTAHVQLRQIIAIGAKSLLPSCEVKFQVGEK